MKDFIGNASFNSKNFSKKSPLECVSDLRIRQHAALFYEDPVYADLIDSWYVQGGLQKGEMCIFATHKEPKEIRERLLARGIRVEFFEGENLLHVCRISDATIDPRGLSKGVGRILDHMFSVINPRLPTRIVSEPWVGEIITTQRIDANMEVERNVHAAFQQRNCDDAYIALEDFNGSLICRYNIVEKNQLSRAWFHNHLLNHHNLIYAPREGVGTAFNTHSKYFDRPN